MKNIFRFSCFYFSLLLFVYGCGESVKTDTLNEGVGRMQSFNLSDVRIEDGLFLEAQQAGLKYLLALDADRLLAPFRRDAGIESAMDNYPNWENTGLDGHIGGHYMSALSNMYAATGDTACLNRANYMIDVLAMCQAKNGNGYIGGVPDAKQMWTDIAEGRIDAGTFSLNNKWVPLYNIHKTFAGLYDVYVNTGNKKALDILVKYTNWMYNVCSKLTDDQIQQMLVSEHGGLNEVFVDVADVTGDKKYLELARRFSHRAIIEPLLGGENKLTGLHANTQIPKVIGFKRYADVAGDSAWNAASAFFWNTVVDKWTISIGGNSVREHFHPADDFSSMIESEQGPETCNTYNMLKLTRLLFLSDPQPKYADYFERALFNHILSSEHREKGGLVYFTPMRPRHYRVYSQPQTSFWCCVGSGIEGQGKYGQMVYSHTDNSLFVNLFIASRLTWRDKNVVLTQSTKFPYDEVSEFKIEASKPTDFNLMIRLPKWVKDGGFKVEVNGKAFDYKLVGGFACVAKTWETGDVVKVYLPMQTSVEYMPDGSNWVSFVHGPIVLGAVTSTTDLDGLWADDSRMGHVANGPLYPINEAPAIVCDDKNLLTAIEPVAGKQLTYRMKNLNNAGDSLMLELKPFFDIHEARYVVYWPVYSTSEYEQKKAEMAKKEKEMLALEARTIDKVQPGEQQPESDHFVKFEKSHAGIHHDRHWRSAAGWFSYEMKKPNNNCMLLVTYHGLEKNRDFDILIDEQVVATVKMLGDKGDVFYDEQYVVSAEVLKKLKNKTINLKFSAHEGSATAGIFGVRLINVE